MLVFLSTFSHNRSHIQTFYLSTNDKIFSTFESQMWRKFSRLMADIGTVITTTKSINIYLYYTDYSVTIINMLFQHKNHFFSYHKYTRRHKEQPNKFKKN